jgi:NAD(P)-dependent dehydrogenase (short-subunit alcohol dehydrogenase family)
MKKTWFITGASRGFGLCGEAALKRGDRVTATARKLADVAYLAERFSDAVLPLALDVTDSAQVHEVVEFEFCRADRALVSAIFAMPWAFTESNATSPKERSAIWAPAIHNRHDRPSNSHPVYPIFNMRGIYVWVFPCKGGEQRGHQS